MKNFKQMILPVLLLSMILFVACNSDDSDPYVYVPLTQAEKTQQINMMQGSYAGKAFYGLDYSYHFTDSAAVTLNVVAQDSMLTISDFPLKAFASSVTNPELKSALQNENTKSLRVQLTLYRPWGTEGTLTNAFFAAVPRDNQSVEAPAEAKDYEVVLPLAINGEVKDVTFKFLGVYANSIYSEGIASGSEIQFNLILEKISVKDGISTNVNCIMGFYGKK